jgi:methylase of polypeptide subunit release factors
MTQRAAATFEARRALLGANQAAGCHDTVVAGLRFDVDRGVFSPHFFESTHVFSEMICISPGQSFLEVGTGCGAIAILAALRGAQAVVATDISRPALANARRNATTHGVGKVVSLVKADVYEGLALGMRFDTIFWNAPWVFVPAEYRPVSSLEYAICDPGYVHIRRFFEGARHHLTDDGRLMIGLGSFADVRRIMTEARATGLKHLGDETRESRSDAGIKFTLHSFRYPRAQGSFPRRGPPVIPRRARIRREARAKP